MSKRAVILRSILHYGILLIVLYILQSMVFPELRLWGVTPLIFPLAVVGTALMGGAFVGGVFGIAAGILCDMCMPETTVLFTALLPAFGIIIGLLGENALARGFPSYIVCVLCVLVLTGFAQSFAPIAYGGMSALTALSVSARQGAYSLIPAIPVYWVVRGVNRRVTPDY